MAEDKYAYLSKAHMCESEYMTSPEFELGSSISISMLISATPPAHPNINVSINDYIADDCFEKSSDINRKVTCETFILFYFSFL